MKLETIIKAWEGAGWLIENLQSYENTGINNRSWRAARQREKFWEHIVERIEDYRVCYLQDAAQIISARCARDDAGYWPYRKSHATIINELIAAGWMRRVSDDPARWRFKNE